MKMRYNLYLIIAAILFALPGCEYDNVEPPESTLTGRIMFQDTPVGVRNNWVQLELWQHGYDDFEKIPVFVAQDGSFSAKLFNGNYKLTLLRGNGPWVDNLDSLDVQVKGSTTIDVPVQPYYMIVNPSISKSGSNIEATFSIDDVNPQLAVEGVFLYIGKSLITDHVHNEGVVSIAGADVDFDTPINLSIEPPSELSGKGYVFARIGVKTVGVSELLYSQVQKIEF